MQSMDKKWEHYSKDTENTDSNSQLILITVTEGTKRVIESMNKKIDSYLFYASNSLKRTINVEERGFNS